MKITFKQLNDLINERVKAALLRRKNLEEGLLFEEDIPANPALKPELGDSLDSQVDKKFIEYEQESKNVKNEGFDIRSMAYRLMFEADDEEDLFGGDESGSDAGAAPAEKLTLQDIDVNEFCSNVARLIENVENLLEFKDTILKRSMNFLKKSYDASVLKQFTQTMEQQFDLVVGEDDVDKEHDITPPPAVGAGVPPGA